MRISRFLGLVLLMLFFMVMFKTSLVKRWVQALEWRALDWRLASVSEEAPAQAEGRRASVLPVVVAFDDETLNALEGTYGRWPWPRAVHAKLITSLNQLGARAVVLDWLYLGAQDAPNDTALMHVVGGSKNTFLGVNLNQLQSVPAEARLPAAPLRNESAGFKDEPLPFEVAIEINQRPCAEPTNAAYCNAHWPKIAKALKLPAYAGFSKPFAGLLSAAGSRVGIINHQRDTDGTSRRNALLYEWLPERPPGRSPLERRLLPQLALSVYAGVTQQPLVLKVQYAESRQQVRSIQLMDKSLPQAALLIRWPQVASFNTVSARQILAPGAAQNAALQRLFKDKVVFVGATAVGLFDIKTTPVMAAMPGVYLQAALYHTLASGAPPIQDAPLGLVLLSLFVPAVLASVSLWLSRSVLVGLWGVVFAIALVFVLPWFAFKQWAYILPVAGPLALLGFVTLAALALKLFFRSQDVERTWAMATTDPLTGVYNRRYFEEELGRMLDNARRTQRAFTLLMIDIDHFKSVNDSFGHPAGDLVLKRVAQLMGQTIRSGDVLARVGGEEFAIILPETALPQGLETARKLVAQMASTPVLLPSGLPLGITVSIGVADYVHAHQSAEALIARADIALYQAKAAGRNRVAPD